MKTKIQNSVQDNSLKLGSFSTPSFRFHFSFLFFCLFVSVAGAEISSELPDPTNLLVPYLVGTSQDVNTPNASIQTGKTQSVRQEQLQSGSDSINAAPVNSAVELDKKLPQGVFTIAPISDSNLGHQLWQGWIFAPNSEKNDRSKAELKRMIEQIRSVKFEPANPSSETTVAIKQAQPDEPNETLSGTKPQKEVEEKQIKSKNENPPPYQPLTSQTLQTIKGLSQHPEQVNNPFELAEILFHSGHLKEAAVFYRQALDRKVPQGSISAQERAWILFQIGNCVRDDDPPSAIKTYRQLISEYPDSPWADLAKTQEKLVSWYQKDEPQKLVRPLSK